MINIQTDEKLGQLDAVVVSIVIVLNVQAMVGREVMLYATRDCSHPGYCGTARLVAAEPEPLGGGRAICRLVDFAPFPHVVPFGLPENVVQEERGIRPEDVASGFRIIDNRFYEAIFQAGHPGTSIIRAQAFSEPDPADFESTAPERWIESTSRAHREEHRREVDARDGPFCFLSHAEIPFIFARTLLQGAHLRPLQFGGIDLPWNIVLMRHEIHVAWDAGLVTLREDGSIAFSSDIPSVVLRSFEGQHIARALQLRREDEKLMAADLEFHRRYVFREPHLAR